MIDKVELEACVYDHEKSTASENGKIYGQCGVEVYAQKELTTPIFQ